ncbi:arsenite methyltransferase-like [Ostrea edulis]|uniref:arsenite methyltransferase-like n=1 Tax=Ostrea edulis TaxID=37623 RepID=UPI0024AF00F5|nr:arsenite methyltransferase-like [Ostrea edulis]XP_056005104.1 arsenite methyltransferase-like [Ostrea edulis]XP_056005105.1 arsenite methyltransferase-like [Ostrea edulis]XP_056005106.1 arsenite methyltransferase-like [Ostrea edulis]XP_056005107.1 arsenite methyltransferase-like [Ostrea edulis]XP_056005109.1 arsenite methyltransferase-like [Ostrea edulis]XP_056005110.1 arsenite methyltransferase-like [Ostrea edulis]XP_056005111.1 arsenite methyltransferase-like [Ostrea edulis]XP_05600511
MEDTNVHDAVKDYYGKQLKSVDDLKTQACVIAGRKVTKPVREAVAAVHEEVASRYFGCGLVIPEKLRGMKILDLGSGSGRDCFALSKLIGPNGHVTGIDMTDEQIAVARKYIDYHTEKFGYKEANIEFVKGYIERLQEAGLQRNCFDIIISNCTINLSPDKRAVIREAFNVLKEGGELYFSDIYVDRQLDDSIRKHKILWGEGFSGALYWKDLVTIAAEVGFSRPYLVTAVPVAVEREDFKQILGDARYASVTYRLFKLPPTANEAPTQVTYKGEISGYEEEFKFDHQYIIKKNDVRTVPGPVAAFLKCSRFSDEFEYHPFPRNSSDTNGITCNKVEFENPFEYLENLAKKGEKVKPFSCGGS